MQLRIDMKLVVLLASIASVAGFGSARAQTITGPSTEYLRRIKTAESVQPLGDSPFGENISLYNGTLSFRQTDISYPGIGPTITLARTYEVSGSPTTYGNDLPMGDWDLSIPRISTIVAGNGIRFAKLWKVNPQVITQTGTVSLARCTGITEINHAPSGYGLAWWHGYQLITEDASSQPLLKRNPTNALAPGNDVAAYPIVTASHWMIGCLASTANGLEGEAFKAVSPDGTKYWLNHLAYGEPLETLIEYIPHMNNPDNPPAPGLVVGSPTDEGNDLYWGEDTQILPRSMGHMYATRVEDRFGNWLTYHYNAANQLTEINASDLRKVAITWRSDAPLVDRITLQPGTPGARTWRYEYHQPTDREQRMLTRVIQPDDTFWEFDLGWANTIHVPPADPDNSCGVRTFNQIPSDEGWASLSIGHPSGLIGTFDLSLRGHARSWAPSTCSQMSTLSPWIERVPVVYTALSMTRKTVQGPGVAPQTWTYRYSPARGSTQQECLASPCQDWKWVEITDPDNRTDHYQFSTSWGHTEGRLQSTVTAVATPGQDAPAGLQSESWTHADPSQAWPFPASLGSLLSDRLSFANTLTSETLSPETLRQITRQDVQFTRRVESFDRFGQAERVVRSNTLGGSRVESISYWPADAQWVLGQPWKFTQDGMLVSQTDYDSRILPLRKIDFGQVSASYGYHSNGLVHTVTDPLLNVTRLTDYHRGVPRRIEFADRSAIVPGVDDFGQIASIEDQLRDTTTYKYDSMGRMTLQSFPVGDSIAWNPVSRNFERSDVAAYGLPPGHWKQTTANGNALVSTFYDALWRPRLLLTEDTGNPSSRSFVTKRYDGKGRETYSSFPVSSLGSVDDLLPGTSTYYDGLGRVYLVGQASELGGLLTRTEYLSKFRTRVTNPRQQQTTTSYQIFDEPTEQAPTRIEAPEGVTTIIERDGFGKPLSIRREGPAG